MTDNKNPVIDPKSEDLLLMARCPKTRTHCQNVITALYDIRTRITDHAALNENKDRFRGASLDGRRRLLHEDDYPLNKKALSVLTKYASNGAISAEYGTEKHDRSTPYIRVNGDIDEKDKKIIDAALNVLEMKDLDNIVRGDEPLPSKRETEHGVINVNKNGNRVAALMEEDEPALA